MGSGDFTVRCLMGNHGCRGPTIWGCNRSGWSISKSEADCNVGIADDEWYWKQGMVMAHYGKVFMRQLNGKV